MLNVSLIFEGYVTRGQVGSDLGGKIGAGLGAGLGALGGGLGLGSLGYYLSLSDDGSERPFALYDTMNLGRKGMICGGLLGALGGSVLGSRIGQKMGSNPESAARFEKNK